MSVSKKYINGIVAVLEKRMTETLISITESGKFISLLELHGFWKWQKMRVNKV
jgi:hypothetical protein